MKNVLSLRRSEMAEKLESGFACEKAESSMRKPVRMPAATTWSLMGSSEKGMFGFPMRSWKMRREMRRRFMWKAPGKPKREYPEKGLKIML